MIELKSRLMLAGAALAISAGFFSGVDAQQKGPADPPPDIAGFIARRGSCSEWAQKAFDAGGRRGWMAFGAICSPSSASTSWMTSAHFDRNTPAIQTSRHPLVLGPGSKSSNDCRSGLPFRQI